LTRSYTLVPGMEAYPPVSKKLNESDCLSFILHLLLSATRSIANDKAR